MLSARARVAFVVAPAVVLALAIAILPCLANALESGMRYMELGNYGEALKFFNQSVDAEPTNGMSHYRRAQCLIALGKKQDALAEYKIAMMLSSDSSIKDDCRKQLSSSNITAPKATIADAVDLPSAKDGKMFKLESSKLDWNLKLSGVFSQELASSAASLHSLARDGIATAHPDAPHMSPQQIQAEIMQGPVHTANLSEAELAALASADLMVIVDHSGSMQANDCPSGMGPESRSMRLAWVAEELQLFGSQIFGKQTYVQNVSKQKPGGAKTPPAFTLITYDSSPDTYHISSQSQLVSTLTNLKAGGGTALTPALEDAFQLHMQHPRQPLLIAIVTDAEIDVTRAEQSIASATKRFPLPNGVFISLLQVGVDAEARTGKTLAQMNNLCQTAGASYNACTAVPFSQLRAEGLGRDIMSAWRLNAQQPRR